MSASVPSEITRLNERYAITNIGTDMTDTFVVEFDEAGDVVHIRRFEAFRRHLYHEPPVVTGDSRKADFTELANFWLRHQHARRYRSLVFAPDGSPAIVAPEDYNTWRGLALTPEPGDWEMNRYHIAEVVCGGNREHEAWTHNWIAAMLQRPGQHAWVALVLKGGQGIGKGYFADVQLGGMFRPKNYVHLTNPEHLTSDFNSHLQDRVYVFADEAFWGTKKAADRLKGLITEDQILINRKHVPQEMQQSAMHIVIASNAEHPFPVERDDRRFLVFQVYEKFKQDQDYFRMLREELEAGGRAAMLDYFLSYRVDWDQLRKPPESDAKKLMKAASLRTEDEWWRDVLDSATEATWAPRRARSEVMQNYTAWLSLYSGRSEKRLTPTTMGQYLARHFAAGGMGDWPGTAKTQGPNGRENAWTFPTLAECRAVFDRATGTQIPWSDAEPATDAVHPTAA